jgi:hypothetical protein
MEDLPTVQRKGNSGRGRPKGIASENRKFGIAKTTPMRVPDGYQEKIQGYLLSFDALLDDFKARSKGTRNWVEANRLIEELESFRVGLADEK